MIARRDFLGMTGAGMVSLALVPLTAEATPQAVVTAIEEIIGNKAPTEGRIKLTLPAIAENASVVPLKVAVESPMTADDHVKAVHLFADGNPLPGVASYNFGPHNGRADFTLRIRLAKTQKIVAVAEMSNGEVYMSKQSIKVTLGGCGG